MPTDIEHSELNPEFYYPLIEPRRNGSLGWIFSVGMIPYIQNQPEIYFCMTDGRVSSLEQHRETAKEYWQINHLKEVSEGHFVTDKGESTGIAGLLRLSEKLLAKEFSPKKVLLVGAIHHESLLTALVWLEKQGFSGVDVTLVDSSDVPVKILQKMIAEGMILWEGKIDVIKSDVRTYQPEEQFDLVIADILAPYMIENFAYPARTQTSPYAGYEQFLAHVNDLLTNKGVFLERTLIQPEKAKAAANRTSDRGIERRVNLVMAAFSAQYPQLSRTAVEDLVFQLFDHADRVNFCGLEGLLPMFRFVRPLIGDKAAAIFDRLHNRHFRDNSRVEVLDKGSGYRFLSFACQKAVPANS